MFQRFVKPTCVLAWSMSLAACGETTSSEVEAGGGDGGTGGRSHTGGAASGTGGIVIGLPDPHECAPALDSRCQAPRVVRDDIRGTLPADATPPLLTRGACGSQSPIELVATGLRDLPGFHFAAMPTEHAPDALYFSHSPPEESLSSVGRITKSDCAYEASFRKDSDLPRAAATESHLLWRPALGSIDAAFQWDALDDSSSESLPFAGGRPVGANATQAFLSEDTSLYVVEGATRTFLASVRADVIRIFGRSALAFTPSGLERGGSGSWVDLDTGASVLLGTSFLGDGDPFWESAVIFESFLYYCSEGLVRADRSGGDDVRIIDGPCTAVVHADSTGLYWTTPNGLARAALDGSAPTLIAPGAELFDDTHIYFFEDADLLRVKRE